MRLTKTNNERTIAMLGQFLGEFFIHPAALDYSGNTCSNNCAYCFASLRTQERAANLRKLSDLCLGKSKGNGMVDWLFNHGYPICVSNKSDPFATSNTDNTGIALQLLDLVPNGVFFQTKGISKGVDPTILDGFKKKNVVMYITIDTMNEEICRRIEPGAPLPKARIELAKYAKARGWFVEIGINPCWKPWMSDADFDKLIEEMDAIGVDNFYLQALSLRQKDIEHMTEARKARMPIGEIGDALTKKGCFDAFMDRYFKLWKAGKNPYINGAPNTNHLMDREVEFLGKGINAVQNFTNFAYEENKKTGRVIFTFADFLSVMFKGNPEMMDLRDKTLYQYIMNICPDEWRGNAMAKTANSYETVYRVLWNSRRMYLSPSQRACFATVTDHDGRVLRDDMGDRILWFLARDGEAVRNRVRTISVDDLKGKGVEL